ncbi:hypothetical protein WA171_001484 [Blastocystis sp. BT1]
MNEPFQTASVIDASPVKFTRITERFVSEISALKQEFLSLTPLLEMMAENPSPLMVKRFVDISNRVDESFARIYLRLGDIKLAKDQIQKLKDKVDPRCDLVRWLFLSMPIRRIFFTEQKEHRKSNLLVVFDYSNLFSVKLVVRVKGTICKTKDIQIFGVNENRTTPYSTELVIPKQNMSSILLFRQMTCAAKRFIQSLPPNKEKNVFDVLRWLLHYDDLYTTKCVICHSQMPLTGPDAFCVPSLRHFDTGSPYHPSCCTGEMLLRT